MDNLKLAELLFPDIDKTPDYYENLYPNRNLKKDARVTRLGPSPTGFIHLGNLYGAVVDERLAHQSDGVFYLRIEDTDNKREVEGAVETLITSLGYFGISFDEGATLDGEVGSYGPYRQRNRAKIYQCFAKELVKKGLAYPCFCSEDDLSSMRQKQEAIKANFGYYGEWAVHRNFTYEEIEQELKNKKPFVLRFKAESPCKKTISVKDGIRGTLTMPKNDQDFVLLKSDKIPTYHFAHVVDDHLMRTTHVVRGEEWLSTLPFHIDLFEAFNWEVPTYCHTAQLMKIDNGNKRKLSKRKDPELSLDFYRSEGYPKESVREYLMTVLNSNFEDWRAENKDLPFTDFKFSTEKMSSSGALFDLDKLCDVSKNTLSLLTAEEIYKEILNWAEEFDSEYFSLLSRDKEFSLKMLSIGRGGEKPRKDISTYKQSKNFFSFFFDELFKYEDEFPKNISKEDAIKILDSYLESYNHNDTQEEWFNKVKIFTEQLGFAPQPKLYKKNPEAYKGHISDVTAVLRVAITGRTNSPDLWCVSQTIGEEKAVLRIKKAKELLK